MKKKTIAGLITVIAIVTIAMFSGCVEEKSPTPISTPTATLSPTVTPTPTPTPLPTKEDTDKDGFSDYFEENIAHTDPNVPNDRYAILVDTMEKPDAWQIAIFYDVLTHDVSTGTNTGQIFKLRFEKENIRILVPEEEIPCEDPALPEGTIIPTWENFKKAVSEIAQKVDKNDLVYIELTGHEVLAKSTNEAGLKFIDGDHSWEEINEVIDKINCRALIITVDCCHTDLTVLDPLKRGSSPRILGTQTSSGEIAHSGEFGRLFLGAYTTPEVGDCCCYPSWIDPDTNQNGYLSVKEAFDYAIRRERRLSKPIGNCPPVHPQVYDSDNIASEIYLSEFYSVDQIARVLNKDQIERMFGDRDAAERWKDLLTEEKGYKLRWY